MERVIERDNLRLAFWKAACGKRTKRDAALSPRDWMGT